MSLAVFVYPSKIGREKPSGRESYRGGSYCGVYVEVEVSIVSGSVIKPIVKAKVEEVEITMV